MKLSTMYQSLASRCMLSLMSSAYLMRGSERQAHQQERAASMGRCDGVYLSKWEDSGILCLSIASIYGVFPQNMKILTVVVFVFAVDRKCHVSVTTHNALQNKHIVSKTGWLTMKLASNSSPQLAWGLSSIIHPSQSPCSQARRQRHSTSWLADPTTQLRTSTEYPGTTLLHFAQLVRDKEWNVALTGKIYFLGVIWGQISTRIEMTARYRVSTAVICLLGTLLGGMGYNV